MEKELAFHPKARLLYRNADGNSHQQIQDILSLWQADIDLLIVSPNEAAPVTPIIEELYQAGLPVVVIDRKITSDAYTTYVGADNYEIGQIAGSYAARLLPQGGRVLEITGLPGSTPAQERHRGFTEALRSSRAYELDTVNGEWEHQTAKRKLSSDSARYLTADLIFAHNDMMALAARQVLEQHPASPPVRLLGIDGLSGPSLGIDLVDQGALDATFLYPTGGDRAVQVALDILEGRTYRKENMLQTTVIDSSNVKVLKLHSDKIAGQQQDIVRQQRMIQEQWTVYRNQQTLLYVVVISLAAAIILGVYALYSLRENRLINRRLRVQNDKITQQRNQIAQMAQEAEAANQAKFTFFTNISHEFRTPLTLILASVDDLIDENHRGTPRSAEAVRQDLLLTRRNTSRLLHLINQLLDFRRLEHTKGQATMKKHDLIAFLREIVSAFERTAQRRQIDYQLVALPPTLEAYFDASMLDKVFFNLLANAFKFTPDRGSIRVRVEADVDQDCVRIRFVDNGQGMSTEQIAHAFDRFYQGVPDQARGTGLGLALAKELVSCHAGQITVSSQPGRGTCFEVTLPLRQGEAFDEVVPTDSAPLTTEHCLELEALENVTTAFSGKPSLVDFTLSDEGQLPDTTVLVVEDNDDLRHFLVRKLRRTYHVLEAADGPHGLKQALARVPDLIVCDVMLPGQDGLAIARTLKSDVRTSHIPIVLLTARATPDQQIAGLRTGVDAYVTKPFHLPLLLEQMDTLLWNREQLRQRFTSTHASSELPAALPDLDRQFLQRLTTFIQQNLAQSALNVNAITQEMGLSRVQLYRKVKALLGVSINDYVKVLRLKEAKRLLLRPDLTIAEVAYAVGFSSPAYFSTVFKAYYQQSPSDFVRSSPVS